MKKASSYNIGDKVLAKVKGYPAWPAQILEDRGGKYNVQFYATLETAIVKPKDVFYYLQHKHALIKALKRKDYNDAIEEIELAIKKAGGLDGSPQDANANNDKGTTMPMVTVKAEKGRGKRKRSASSDPNVTKTENDEPAINNSGTKETPHKSVTEPLPKKLKGKRLTSTSEEDISTDETENIQPSESENQLEKCDTFDDDKKSSAEPAVRANDIKIVTEDYLKAIVAYAEFVRKEPNIFKRKHIDPRQTFKNETVVARLPSGRFIGIKYNRDPIPPMKNEHDRAIYDETEAKTVLSLKKLLEEGKCDPHTDKTLFIMNLDITDAEIREIIGLEIIQQKQKKINLLKIEANLIECDNKIKKSLSLDSAQTKPALQLLDRILHLEIQPLMLKKHPHIVEMVRRLRSYIGNVGVWNLTEEQAEEFKSAAAEIRNKADDVFYKFSELFNMPNETLFWEVFTDEVENFKEQVSGYSESVIFSLTSEPNCRQSFLNKIEDDEEMKIISCKMEKTKPENENGGVD